MFFLCQRPRSFWTAALVLVLSGGLLGGCVSSNPPVTASGVSNAQDTTWAVVPLWPPTDQVKSISVERHRKMVDELTTMLSAYEQEFAVYKQSDERAGLPPDTLYENSGTEGNAPSFSDEVVRDIRRETGAEYLLIMQANQWSDPSGDGLQFFAGVSSDGLGVGVEVPILSVGGELESRPVTSAILLDASTEEIVWEGARFTGVSSATTDLERAAILGSRSLVVEMMTGRALPYANFLFDESSGGASCVSLQQRVGYCGFSANGAYGDGRREEGWHNGAISDPHRFQGEEYDSKNGGLSVV